MADDEHNDECGVTGILGRPLGSMQLGFKGRIKAIHHSGVVTSDRPVEDLESRLVELGFVEGAAVEVLHEGLIGRDPIAVRVDGTTVALRRREAMAIIVISAAESHDCG